MATQVFISWSGDLSRQLAEAVHNWLPSVLQYVKPYFSPDDIEKGAKWNSDIARELENSNIGLICLTQGNTDKPWILFEAGALSKSFDKSKVCTIFFNLEPTDLKGPLTSFQATKFTKKDFKRLISTINDAAGDAKLTTSVLEEVFTMWWPKLEKQVSQLLDSHTSDSTVETRSERDMLEEVLELARMGASRSDKNRTLGISRHAVMDLIGCIDDLHFILDREDSEVGLQIFRKFDRLLRYLCRGAGMSEDYERFRMHPRTRRLFESAEEEAERDAE